MSEIFCRGPGYWDGSRSSVGKHEAARRSGALSGMSMSGSPMDSDRRRVGFSAPSSEKKQKRKKVCMECKRNLSIKSFYEDYFTDRCKECYKKNINLTKGL